MEFHDETIENISENAELFQSQPTPEHVRDPYQKWCVVSIVCPKGTNQKTNDSMIKIYGCTNTVEAADEFAAKINKDNPYYDVFVMPTCEWGVIPPKIDDIDEVHSNDARVQQIYNEFKNTKIQDKKNLEKRLEIAHERKKKPEILKEK